MLIRKNTKAFKTIVEIVSACQSRADREKLIRLFITKAGNTIHERISVDAIQGDAALFYEMNYQTVLNSLRSTNHQLNESDEIPGLYFFHSTSNKRWDETPFEFDEAVRSEFGSLPDLPTVRRKEKSEKFILSSAKTNTKTQPKATGNSKVVNQGAKNIVLKTPKQPDFKLKHKIEFTNLDKIIFRQPVLNKEQILGYYNKISEHLLLYLRDRSQWVRTTPDKSRPLVQLTRDSFFGDDHESIPDWLQSGSKNNRTGKDLLLVKDRERLLFFVEHRALEFHPVHSREKQREHPDYIVITVDSPDSEITKAVEVTLEAKNIMDGLKLPSFVKTDGLSGLHLYIPLDSKTNFVHARDCASNICRLIRLKIPDSVAVTGLDENSFGKVSMDYTINEEGQTIIAPYSLVFGESVTVATPLLWEEVGSDLHVGAFTPETIFKRIKRVGDPFEVMFEEKVNAELLLKRLEENYSFLF